MTSIDNQLTLLSCPWFLIVRSPAVAWVSELYEWREKGCVGWADLPVFGRRAITAFSRGVSARRDHEREKAEQAK